MKIAAMIIGLLGGVINLFFGLAGSAVLSVGGASGALAPIIVAVVGLIGAALVLAKPVVAGAMMGLSLIAFLFWFGINVVTAIPLLLVGAATGLTFLSLQETGSAQ